MEQICSCPRTSSTSPVDVGCLAWTSNNYALSKNTAYESQPTTTVWTQIQCHRLPIKSLYRVQALIFWHRFRAPTGAGSGNLVNELSVKAYLLSSEPRVKMWMAKNPAEMHFFPLNVVEDPTSASQYCRAVKDSEITSRRTTGVFSCR